MGRTSSAGGWRQGGDERKETGLWGRGGWGMFGRQVDRPLRCVRRPPRRHRQTPRPPPPDTPRVPRRSRNPCHHHGFDLPIGRPQFLPRAPLRHPTPPYSSTALRRRTPRRLRRSTRRPRHLPRRPPATPCHSPLPISQNSSALNHNHRRQSFQLARPDGEVGPGSDADAQSSEAESFVPNGARDRRTDTCGEFRAG